MLYHCTQSQPSLSKDLHDRVVQWCIQNNWSYQKLTWLAAQLTQLLIFWCTTMSMEPQQTHTERDKLNILSTWMQGYRMVNEAVQCAVIFWLSFRFGQWEQDWPGVKTTLLDLSTAQVEVCRTSLWMRVSGQRERIVVEHTKIVIHPMIICLAMGKVAHNDTKKIEVFNELCKWL